MAEISDRHRSGREIYTAIGDFMFGQGLDPTPTNYMLLHQLITGSNPEAVAAIEEATSDGVRLSQKEANRIMEAVGIVLEERETVPAAAQTAMREVREQMESFTALVASTHEVTRSYEQDLESSANELVTGAHSLAELIRITSAMLERTRNAENQLAAATDEAVALREKLQSAQLEARRDPLTGIPNRRAFEDHYAALTEKGTPCCVAICDLDRFKTINDTHGHSVGDRVLRTVANTLERALGGHMVARLGGEEFGIVVAGTSMDAAKDLIERARQAVSLRRLKVRETDLALGVITLSAGIAYSNGDSLEDILGRADQLLYRAKAGGRDQVLAEEDHV